MVLSILTALAVSLGDATGILHRYYYVCVAINHEIYTVANASYASIDNRGDSMSLVPTPTISGSVTPSNTTLTPNQLALLAQKAGFSGASLVDIVAIMLAESGGRIDAGYNGFESGTHNSVGLAQINLNAHPNITLAQALNPIGNLAAAYQISNGGTNFTPWSTYTSGAYVGQLTTANAAVNTTPTSSDNAWYANLLKAASAAWGDVTFNPQFGGAVGGGVSSAESSITNSIVGTTIGAITHSFVVELIVQSIIGLILIVGGFIMISGTNIPSMEVA